MATQVLSTSHAHLSRGSEAFTSNMYPGYGNYSNFPPSNQSGYVYNTEQQNVSFPVADSWPDQNSTLRRLSSRSPSLHHDRTPIRHHPSTMPRSRSTSKSEVLLAYATEQSVQQQNRQRHQSAATTPSVPQTTPSTTPAIFAPQAYSSMSPASPYVQQTGYYANTSPQFSEVHGQQSTHGMPEYFAVNRHDLQVSPMSNTTLSPNDALFLQNTAQSRPTQIAGLAAPVMGFPSLPRTLESTSGGIEVSSSRNKPQCWDHGCNGRQFSTFSNLLRHQREKSGTAAKARCPHCGTEFTRTTARNGHMYGGKCKGMPDSKRSPDADDDGNSEQ